MQKRKLRTRLVFFILTFFIISSVSAKGNTGHSEDMFYVLGLNTECYSSVQQLFKIINDSIDYYNDFYDKLKQEFKYFSYGEYGHRIIYHWGFDLDKDLTERSYQDSLAQLFNAKIYAGYSRTHDNKPLTEEIWYEEWEKFLNFLGENQKRQNEMLTNTTRQVLGLNNSASRDVAAILYYTHLLGDHIEHSGAITGDSVLDLNKIEKNLSFHIKSLSKKCDWYYSDYEQSVKSIISRNDRERAQEVLNCLCATIPKILEYKYSEEFAAKNLTFYHEPYD